MHIHMRIGYDCIINKSLEFEYHLTIGSHKEKYLSQLNFGIKGEMGVKIKWEKETLEDNLLDWIIDQVVMESVFLCFIYIWNLDGQGKKNLRQRYLFNLAGDLDQVGYGGKQKVFK